MSMQLRTKRLLFRQRPVVVRGTTEGDVDIFKGIPYAAPPVGEYRWRPPQPVAAWQGERDATKYGANCAQSGLGGAPGSIQRRVLLKIACILIYGCLQELKRMQNCRLWYGSTEVLSLVAAGKIQEISLPDRESSWLQ